MKCQYQKGADEKTDITPPSSTNQSLSESKFYLVKACSCVSTDAGGPQHVCGGQGQPEGVVLTFHPV